MLRAARRGAAVGWILSVVAVGSAAWWAASATLEPPQIASAESRPATYSVVDGTLEQHFDYTAEATWPTAYVLPSAATGLVTDADVQVGREVAAGDVLFRVDERPVVVAHGDVPMFRDLSAGMTGRDVSQLQEFLVALGYYQDEPSGTFTAGTRTAVRAWQRAGGLRADGIVARGDLMFVPSLPLRIGLADGVDVGRTVAAGTDAMVVYGQAPAFTLTLAEEQLDLIPLDAAVQIEHASGVWDGVIESIVDSIPGEVTLVLADADGAAICDDDCLSIVPPGQTTYFRARVVVIPETSGPIVPAAAIQTDPSGDVFVTRESGEQVPVELITRHAGHAIVSGVESGDVIMLFGSEPDGL